MKQKGEKGHFRYHKDIEIDKNRIARGRAAICKDTKKEEKKVIKPSFTEEGAKKLSRDEQVKLLKSRGVKTSWKDKEKDLIQKIISSNPK